MKAGRGRAAGGTGGAGRRRGEVPGHQPHVLAQRLPVGELELDRVLPTAGSADCTRFAPVVSDAQSVLAGARLTAP